MVDDKGTARSGSGIFGACGRGQFVSFQFVDGTSVTKRQCLEFVVVWNSVSNSGQGECEYVRGRPGRGGRGGAGFKSNVGGAFVGTFHGVFSGAENELVTDKNEKSRKPQKTSQEIVWQCRCIYRGLFNVKLTDGRGGGGEGARDSHFIETRPKHGTNSGTRTRK